jgi:hypothetical protein
MSNTISFNERGSEKKKPPMCTDTHKGLLRSDSDIVYPLR